MNGDLISRKEVITAIQKAYVDTERGMDKCAVWKNVGLTNALHIMQDLPSAQPTRIEQALHGKTAEEQYEVLRWLMHLFGREYTDSRVARIMWLKGEL